MNHRLLALGTLLATPAAAAQNTDQLAKQLANPLAALTSVPLQLNYEREGGRSGDADRTRLNIQPVIPFDLGEDWNPAARELPGRRRALRRRS